MKNVFTYIAIALAIVGYNAMTSADRDASGAIVGEGNVGAFEINVGDCFDDTSSLYSGESGQVSSLPGVPCAEPHDNEVFAVFDVDMDSFPGTEAMSDIVFESCLERFESFVGRDYESSALDIMTLYPSLESWKQKNDREVVCAVYDMEAKKLEGSARGLAL